MTNEERNICITTGNAILLKSLESIAAEVYPDGRLQNVVIEGFALPELFAMLKRAITQLLHELKTDAWKVLPNAVLDANENLTDQQDNVVLLTRQLEFILFVLTDDKDIRSFVPEILFLVRYEMHFGFWDRSKTKVHDSNSLEIIKSKSEIALLVKTVERSLRETEGIRKKLNQTINDLDEYGVQKENQFTSLEKSITSVSQSLAEVRDSEKEAAISNGKMATLLEQAEKLLDTSRERIIEDKRLFDELKDQVSLTADSSAQRVNELSVFSELFNRIIESAREKEQHILSQEEEIMRLIGHATDGRLATAFSERERIISNRVDWWRTASIAVVVFAIFWAGFIFYFYNPTESKSGINWLVFLANIVRSSPAFLLVFFSQSQYTKERNLQEEYAFKSAVSRTVTSYADMIGTGEVNERVKMLIETIQRIYTAPALGKPDMPVSLKSEHLVEATKNVADATGNLKTTITDALKSLKSDKATGKAE